MFARALARRLGVGGMAALALAGCGTSGEPGTGSAGDRANGQLEVVTGFYAAQYVLERIGGDRLEVTSLTPPGVEPHDLELTAKQVASLAEADLIVTLAGFQTAVDEGIAASQAGHVVDLGPSVGVEVGPESDQQADPQGGAPVDLADDPHFWLDPRLMAKAADAIAQRLSTLDPTGSPTYATNLATLQAELTQLSERITSELATCRQPEIVVSHAAFGHLAHIAGLTQHALTLNPDSDPSPATLAEISDLVRAKRITTIYTEPLISPRVAQVVAAETGADTAVLDPIEGPSGASAAGDYIVLMRANIDALAIGQQCTS